MKRLFYLLLPLFIACKATDPLGTFATTVRPNPPDYAQKKYWAALPTEKDNADLTPPTLQDMQATAEADVFLYPTIYTGRKKYQTNWNAPVDYAPFNADVDKSPIKYQATLFNAAGRIYAPRYRQAHIRCYWLKGKDESVKQAFELAYEDVKNAFEYYLKNFNDGRPIIIAGHSQGSTHAKRLLSEYFDEKPLQKQLVVAYMAGMPIIKNQYKAISPCENPTQTGCFCSWRTFEKGYEPKRYPQGTNITSTNPLTWRSDENYANADLNLGGVVTDFKLIRKGIVDAQNHNGLLWCKKPKFPGSFLMRTGNFHPGDYNLFYINVRENAQLRVQEFLKK